MLAVQNVGLQGKRRYRSITFLSVPFSETMNETTSFLQQDARQSSHTRRKVWIRAFVPFFAVVRESGQVRERTLPAKYTVRCAASPSACLPARFTPLLWSGNPSLVLLSPAVDHKVLALDSHTMVSCTNDPVP